MADIVADDVALDRDGAGVGIDLHHGQMTAIGIDLVRDMEPAIGAESGFATMAHG